jgi:hypothetical protein
MAKGKKSATSAAVTLPIVTRAAAIGAEDALPPRDSATRAATAAAAPSVLDDLPIQQLLDYEPPPLPAQPAAIDAFTRGAAVQSFRAASAAAALPPVPITYDVGSRTWLLLSDYNYTYQGHKLTAKAGFAFDLASIPRPLWWLIAPNELSIVAPLFHDLLYVYRGQLQEMGEVDPHRTYTRRETDDLFLHLMEVEGVSRWRRYAAYSAVRAAGGIYWAT